MRPLFCTLLCTALSALPLTGQQSPQDSRPPLADLVDSYLTQVYYGFAPSAGTSAGLHQYDSKLEDYSPQTIAREIALQRQFQTRFEAVDMTGQPLERVADRKIVLSSIQSALLTLETIKPFATNPDTYSSGVTGSAFSIMERPYAPAETRLEALIARERQMPHLLEEARTNLSNPPHIYTEIALQQIDGDVSFFQNDVPSAFPGLANVSAAAPETISPATRAAFESANAAVIEALKSYGAWMKSDLLPRSNGDFRLGPATLAKKLQYDEMVDLPLDRLLAIALADLHRNQTAFAKVAASIDPARTPQQVLAELASIHPAPDQLLSTFQHQFSSLIAFIDTRHIITIPSQVQPTLEETPPFMRATTQASMDPPGPFETHSTRAYFNVTLPDPKWSHQQTEEYMAAFNVGTITSTAVHEAYPGHYIQFLWMPQFPSKVRKVFGANTNIEGWAHYCEQMMLDEGYLPPGVAAGSKEAKLIRLGQLQDALLRDARFVVTLRMQAGVGGAMSTDQAVEFFIHEGYQSRPVAEVETKRGSSDDYLYYTLGKLQIMKLRADLQAKQGAAFNLEDFHNALMRQGFAPIKLVRRALLGDDSPTL